MNEDWLADLVYKILELGKGDLVVFSDFKSGAAPKINLVILISCIYLRSKAQTKV